MTCAVDGCERPAKKAGVCWAHRKRKQRKGHGLPTPDISAPVREYGLHPRQHLERVSLLHADADTDEGYRRARDLLVKYALALARACARRSKENVPRQPKTPGRGQEGADK